MLELLLNNLIFIGIAMGLLSVSWLSNFVLSLYYNIKLLSQPFDWTRLFNGGLKLLTVVLGTALLVVSITFVPIFLQFTGVEILDEYIEFFSVLTIIVIFAKSIFAYVKQAYTTLSGIIEFKN